MPPPDLGLLRVGDTVPLNLTGSGLSDAPINFYVRRACVDLWKHLSAQKTPVSCILGSMGIGKSLEVYAYAMREASVHGKRVIYVHTDDNEVFDLLAAGGDGVRSSHVKLKVPVWSFVQSALEQKSVDLIVLDGNLPDLIPVVFAALRGYPGVRLISCTNFQAIPTAGRSEHENYIVDSWTKEELQRAVDKKALVLDPSVESLDEAYFYAGGCARMMQWPVQKTMQLLDAAIDEALGK